MPGLARVDVLIHQPARELFEPAIDLALESEAGTSNGTRAASCFISSRAHVALGRVPRLVLEILPHARAQRVERLEFAEVLRELVVELRAARGA